MNSAGIARSSISCAKERSMTAAKATRNSRLWPASSRTSPQPVRTSCSGATMVCGPSKLPSGFLRLDRLMVIEKQNTATDAAALIIPSVGGNRDRHPRLQRFMLANDSTTIAVEVTVWLDETDIAALEDKYRVTIVPKE